MPALFAYLIAVGLLLGGGYGALSWLAAPEPVKVAVKVKPRPPRHDQAGLEVNSQRDAVASASDAGSSSPGNSDQSASAGIGDHTAAVPNGQSSSRQSGPGMAAMEAEVSEPARDQQNRFADAEAQASLPDARQKVRQPAPAASPVLSSNQPTTPTAAVATKAVKRSHLRQAGSHPQRPAEKRALVAMTLRTIEFADGRRVTRLIPYRSPERAVAFEPDEY
ncbi:MAG: hypothetical protein QOJ15_7586 [Bradyrhizobium sp.]|nr:hypothetical protein [Bradyrhizobium sp.]